MKSLYIPLYHLYILQLENYELVRYLRAVNRAYNPPPVKLKKELVWTVKMRVVFFLSLLLHIGFGGFVSFLFSGTSFYIHAGAGVLAVAAGFFLYPVWASLGTLVLLPFDLLGRTYMIGRARVKLRTFPALRVIGITGSYGKTTMKEVVAAVLAAKYRILKTSENINTPVGVARLILNSLTKETEILIVEMGAHYSGDIKELCRLTTPEVSILTGINESHLERLKTMENTIATKFEIVVNAKKGARVLLNGDDARVMSNYEKYLDGRKVLFYYSYPNANDNVRYKASIRNPSAASGIEVAVRMPGVGGEEEVFKTNLMADYAVGLVSAVLQIAEIFEVGVNDVRFGLSRLTAAPHRLKPQMLPNNILLIDDSYNGNPDGVREAIKVLARQKTRRRVFVTPGLVETGDSARAVHKEIGRQLSGVADLVVLIKNSVTPYILEGLREAGYADKKIVWLEPGVEAFGKLRALMKPNDAVLLQNDWPENYS